MSTIGERIIMRREELGLSQRALANLLGITPTRLNYWEKDKREPDVYYIKKLAEVLETTGNYIIGISDTGISQDAIMVAMAFEKLDPAGQRIIKALLDMETGRHEALKAEMELELERRAAEIEARHQAEREAQA